MLRVRLDGIGTSIQFDPQATREQLEFTEQAVGECIAAPESTGEWYLLVHIHGQTWCQVHIGGEQSEDDALREVAEHLASDLQYFVL